MTRRLQLLLIPIVLALALLLGACGKSSPTVTHTVTVQQRAPFKCRPKSPPQMGECVRQELEYDSGHKVEPPKFSPTAAHLFHAQGIDVSRWQGCPDWSQLHREGVRFAIVQVADNDRSSNPSIGCQIVGAYRAGIAVGVYVFVERASSTSQADATINAARPYRRYISLGAWIDTEVTGAYEHACQITHVLSAHFYIVGTYTSPGLWPGFSGCGLVWPAEWGSSLAVAPAGWSHSAIALRQWCGTCHLSGVGEIDRDEDLGAIGRSQSRPKPKPKPLTKKQATVKLAQVNRLLGAYDRRRNPHGHNCQHPPYKHAYPSARYNGACAKWAAEAKALRKRIG